MLNFHQQFTAISLIVYTVAALIGQVHLVDVDNFQPIFQQDGKTIRRLKGEEVLRAMNQSQDPCVDFYEFACGNRERASQSQSTTNDDDPTPLTKLRRKIDSVLHLMLSENVTIDESFTDTKIKTFYKTCLIAERNGLMQQEFFSGVIQNNSGFPAVPGANWFDHQAHLYNWEDVIAHLHYNYDMNILLGIEMDVNRLIRRHHCFYFTQPPTTIPSWLCHQQATEKWNTSDAVYVPIINEVADNLKGWLTLNLHEAKRVARSIVDFEFELCSGMQSSNITDDQKNYPRHTLATYTEQFRKAINFNTLMTKSFGTVITTPVIMDSEPYYHHLIKVLTNHNTTTIANYVMYRALAQLSLPKDSRRWEYCLGLVKTHFPKIVGEIYKRKFINLDVRNYTENLYMSLRSTFNQSSLHREWFTSGDRGKWQFNDVRLKFPEYEREYLGKLEIDPHNYWRNLANVLMHSREEKLKLVLKPNSARPRDEVESYDARVRGRSSQRYVELGWSLLQDPLYNEHYPNSMSHAMIGQQIASELVRIFDDILWPAYKSHSNQWDAETLQAYGDRMECYRQQMSNYLYNNPGKYQNESNIRNFIINSGGLNVAFNTYLNWLDFLNPNNDFVKLSMETLPHVNFSNTQLFFIAYAQMYCRRPSTEQNYKQRQSRMLSPLETHSPERYEVNGPLKNFVEFAREFRCPLGSPMNPVDKCVVY